MSVKQVIVPPISPSLVETEGLRVEIQSFSHLELDSIFPTPSRNAPCHCGSGEKYKRCHLGADQQAWRTLAKKTRQAEVACALLRATPSIEPTFNPEFAE